MSINGQHEYLLQVASGLHRGVEQALPLGDYTLGRDPSCDIVLSDGSLADQHLRFSFERRRVTVEPLDGQVLLDEEPLTQATELTMPCRLSLGTVLIEIDRLFELSAEDLDEDSDESRFEGAAAGAAAGAFAASGRQAPRSGEYVDDTDSSWRSRAGGFLPNRGDARSGKGGGGLTRVLITVGMLALIPLGAFPIYLLLSSGFGEQTSTRQSSVSVSMQIDQILEELALKPHARVGQFTALEDAPINLYGDRGRLLQSDLSQRLNQASIPHKLAVYDIFDLAEQANRQARELGYNVLVEPGEAGEVVVSGFVDNDEDLARIVRHFDQQVPGIHYVNTNRLVVGTIAVTKAQELVSRSGLSEYLSVHRELNTVVAKGSLPSSARANWQNVKSQFDALYAPYMQITDGLAAEGGGAPLLAIRAVWAGLRPYIIFDDGGVYFEGTVVEGWTIESIRDDRVVVRRDNEVVDLTF